MTEAEKVYEDLQADWQWLQQQRVRPDAIITPTEVLSFKWAAAVPSLFYHIGVEPTEGMRWRLRQCLVNNLSFREFVSVIESQRAA